MFTYTGDPTNVIVDAIRVEIGDTLVNQHELEDEEINYAYAREGTVLKAAARCCEFLAAKYAKREDFRAGGIQSVKTTMSAKFAMMSRRLRARSIRATSFVMPASSVASKRDAETNTDLPTPSFKKGMFNNPDADGPLGDNDDIDITGRT